MMRGPGGHFMLEQETSKAENTGATLARMGRYFRPYMIVVAAVLLMMALNAWVQVAAPDLIGQAVDCFIDVTPFSKVNCWYTPVPSQDVAALGVLILKIAGLYLAGAVTGGAMFYMMAWAGQHVLTRLREEVFTQLHRLSLGYYTRHEAGDLMSRITNDTDTIQQVVGFALVNVASGIVFLIWLVITMFLKSPVYAALTLAVAPVMALITVYLSTQARRAFRRSRREMGSVNADLQESISAVREVQAFSREGENIEAFRQSSGAYRDANIRAVGFTAALAPALAVLGYVSIAIVAGLGGLWALRGAPVMGTVFTLGLVVTFLQYSQRFNQPIQQISVLWTNIQSAIAGAERIFGLLDEVPDVQDRPGARLMPPIRGEVDFDDVQARYEQDGLCVLCGVSLHAAPGQTVAIVGPTGAGKTTLINLIPRFWDVTGGVVTIDGIDVRDVTRASLRSQIGIVLQDTFLFSDTVMNNIRYGRPEATDAQVIAAAQLVHADEFIQRLPEGYETRLGERGSGLSQGQRQLIAIARVALADPRILILDEATSSVDTRTERLIQAAFAKLLAGRTSFVIAHRLSTIRNADQVLVMNDGQIVERGTHPELLARKGFYYDLYMSQFRGEEAPAPAPNGDGHRQERVDLEKS